MNNKQVAAALLALALAVLVLVVAGCRLVLVVDETRNVSESEL